MADPRLNAAQREMLEYIARGGDRGRMLIAIIAPGGSAGRTLQHLRNLGLVETNLDAPIDGPDFVRVTAKGRGAGGGG